MHHWRWISSGDTAAPVLRYRSTPPRAVRRSTPCLPPYHVVPIPSRVAPFLVNELLTAGFLRRWSAVPSTSGYGDPNVSPSAEEPVPSGQQASLALRGYHHHRQPANNGPPPLGAELAGGWGETSSLNAGELHGAPSSQRWRRRAGRTMSACRPRTGGLARAGAEQPWTLQHDPPRVGLEEAAG